jgi:hypothetical protein
MVCQILRFFHRPLRMYHQLQASSTPEYTCSAVQQMATSVFMIPMMTVQ